MKRCSLQKLYVPACAFALLGGINRYIETGSRYGVHQFAGGRANIGDSTTQVAVVLLATYLEEMGVSRNLLDVASLVSPDQLYWLSQEEMQRLNDNMTIEKMVWTLNALDDGTVFTSIVQKKPGPQSQVGLAIVKHSGHPVLLMIFVPGEPGVHALQTALEALNPKAIRLAVDGKQVAEYPGGGWWTVRKDAVIARVPLSQQTINAIRTGIVLRLEVPVAHIDEQYDPSLEFPLDGLSRFLSAVLK